MYRVSLIATAGILALWLGGCGGDADQAVSPPPEETTVAVPVPNPAGDPAATQSLTAPNAPKNQAPPRGNLPPELISSTNPNQRLQVIQRSRPDPFSLVPTTPVVVQTTTPGAEGSAAPASPPVNPPPSGQLAPIPNLVPQTPPPPPQPDLARAVRVMGVVQIGLVPHAIVQAPNEPSSRYVRAGQRLANGQVLVRRIEVHGAADPVVVLEENGMEVVTAVGEGGTPANDQAQPAASVSPGQPAATVVVPRRVASNAL